MGGTRINSSEPEGYRNEDLRYLSTGDPCC